MTGWRKTLVGCFVLALGSIAFAGVDLTPSAVEIDEDGFKYQQLRFKSDGGTVLLVPPEKWSFSGGPGRLQLTPPGKDFAEGLIEAASYEKPTPIDEAARAQFKQQVLAGVPPGSQRIETLTEAENTVMPAGNPSFELVLSYELWGKSFRRSALLVHTPRERLAFRLTAQQTDFPSLLIQFHRSVMTWQFIEAKPPPTGETAGTAAASPSQLAAR